MGRESVAFQTLLSHKAPAEAPSDSIHMTTYPPGVPDRLLVAFEYIHPDCGPVEYYPGSHAYRFSRAARSAFPRPTSGGAYEIYFERYEPAIANLVSRESLVPSPSWRKRDVLFWHANLIHAGSPRRNPRPLPKAAVCLRSQGRGLYHDLAGTLADPGRSAERTDIAASAIRTPHLE